MNILKLTAEPATAESLKGYGTYIGEAVQQGHIEIPFYKDVEEGGNLPFDYRQQAVVRTVRIQPNDKRLKWLERHMHLTQLFVGLGDQPFAMVLGAPTHEYDSDRVCDLPDLNTVKCFVFEPGTGVILNKGTWHDFPIALNEPVSCLTANSAEVVEALQTMEKPGEMNFGDIFKVSLEARLNCKIEVNA